MTAEPLAAGVVTEATRPARRAVFHRLPIAHIDRLTDDAVAITFDVPEELRPAYAFEPGQHVSVRSTLAGDDVRRNYSICEPSTSGRLRIAVKRLPDGAFSAHALEQLRVGDELDVMTPAGRFGPRLDPARSRRYAAIAAGSGITPILSILASALAIEPASEATLVYGNRTASSIMFLEEISDLKDRYPERFSVVHVLSREPRDAEMFHGRLDAERIERLLASGVLPPESDEWYLCGPPGMIDDARTVLAGRGVDPAHVHRELFHAGPPPPRRPQAPDEPGGRADAAGAATVTVILDGLATTFPLQPDGESILDATLRVRADAPFACKGGVCGTCRARLIEGRVDMDQNYALEDDELAAGTVLACQSHPATSRVTLEYGG